MKELPPPLQEMLQGYRASRVLITAVELDVFSALRGGASVRKVARRTGASERGVGILLHALAALGLIRKKGERFFNTPPARDWLSAGGKNDWRLGIGHHFRLWDSWSKLTESVKHGRPMRAARRSGAQTRAFIGLMHQLGSVRAPSVVSALPIHGIRTFLDLGGGSGIYSIELARRHPAAKITLVDRPEVLRLAKRYAGEAGVRKNFSFVPGDLERDEFGRGFDLALISAICHQFSPEQNVDLFKRAFRALGSGGRLAVGDFILNEARTGPEHAALFAVNMLVNTPGGNSYTLSDYRDWLKTAGFRSASFRRLPGLSDLVLARK